MTTDNIQCNGLQHNIMVTTMILLEARLQKHFFMLKMVFGRGRRYEEGEEGEEEGEEGEEEGEEGEEEGEERI